MVLTGGQIGRRYYASTTLMWSPDYNMEPQPSVVTNRLDVVQSKALRIIANTFITTPTDSIQVELGVMPLSLLRMKLCFNYWAKVKNITPQNPVNALIPQLTPTIGQKCKSTEGVGDSFITRMSKLAIACNTD